ncbi:MAG: hypothetical protein Q7T72_02205 [Bacteroidales bacterium]|nr:hypothetical protein [Bacteroidales bacterium]
MIYLLLILLLFGLFQSLLELRKDDTIIFKWKISKLLAVIYILCFIIGLIVAIIQDKDTNKVKDIINSISSSVTKINKISSEQFENITKSFKQTQLLIKKSDSANVTMTRVIEANKKLIAQYNEVNAKLSSQLEIERQQLMERAPNIDLSEIDVRLDTIDSPLYTIEACIRNLGKRNAQIKSGCGYILFFNNNNVPIKYVEIRGNNVKSILEPSELRNMKYCYYSFNITEYNKLKTVTDFAIICLKINYNDIAINKDSLAYYYCGWRPSFNIFGGLKDWQYGLAKNWIKKNIEFYDK